ncbi:MAG: hypothetical protein EBW16_01835 [Burkholderiaceae bacterium]|nr:hypothetical protein [Burkholderiaceae bacterium]
MPPGVTIFFLEMFQPEIKQKFADMGMEVVGGSPADFSKFIGNDITKWRAPVVKRNIKPD